MEENLDFRNIFAPQWRKKLATRNKNVAIQTEKIIATMIFKKLVEFFCRK
jgi:hypothetical protein